MKERKFALSRMKSGIDIKKENRKVLFTAARSEEPKKCIGANLGVKRKSIMYGATQ